MPRAMIQMPENVESLREQTQEALAELDPSLQVCVLTGWDDEEKLYTQLPIASFDELRQYLNYINQCLTTIEPDALRVLIRLLDHRASEVAAARMVADGLAALAARD